MMPAQSMTPRQREVLEVVRHHIEDLGFPPTYREVADAIGFRSPNAAQEILIKLHEMGAIKLIPSQSRGIRVTGEATKAEQLDQALSHLRAMVEVAECNDPLNPSTESARSYLNTIETKESP